MNFQSLIFVKPWRQCHCPVVETSACGCLFVFYSEMSGPIGFELDVPIEDLLDSILVELFGYANIRQDQVGGNPEC